MLGRNRRRSARARARPVRDARISAICCHLATSDGLILYSGHAPNTLASCSRRVAPIPSITYDPDFKPVARAAALARLRANRLYAGKRASLRNRALFGCIIDGYAGNARDGTSPSFWLAFEFRGLSFWQRSVGGSHLAHRFLLPRRSHQDRRLRRIHATPPQRETRARPPAPRAARSLLN